MIILFLLCLHVFLLLVYALAIETHRSRHQMKSLLLAACLPFVGELCLFASEFGKTAPSFDTQRVFRFKKRQEQTRHGGVMEVGDTIDRETLLRAIEEKPDNLVAILRQGLRAPDMEVVHVAAATIMKLQREQELRVAQCAEAHGEFPGNMELLLDYCRAVGDYYGSGLLEGEAQNELLLLQERQLDKLLAVLPGHPEGTVLKIRNLWYQGRREEAFALCERQRQSCFDFAVWEQGFLMRSQGMGELAPLLAAAKPVSAQWSRRERKAWQEYERSVAHVEA